MNNNPIQLIQSVDFTINGVIHTHIDGQNNAIMDHQNINEDNCLVCRVFRSKDNHNGSEFQNIYGTKHVYDTDNKKYQCYIGELVVNEFYVEYLELVEELFP